MRSYVVIVVVLFLVALHLHAGVRAKKFMPVELKIHNEAGDPIEVFWIDDQQRLVNQSERPMRNNSELSLDAYHTHQFTIRWHKHLPGSEVNFTVSAAALQVLRVRFDPQADQLYFEEEDETTDMKKTTKAAEVACEYLRKKNKYAFRTCFIERMVDEARRIKEDTQRLRGFRSQMSERLRNYTCEDDAAQTTEEISNHDFYHLDKSYVVKVLLDEDNAKIWMIEDFATEQECDALMDAARPKLQRAQVHGDDGNDAYSETRKAQQGDYEFQLELRRDKLWPLYDRTLRAVNYHAKLSIHPEGQEGFSIIQYNPGDEYMSHCDGACDGTFYLPRGRVATSVLYCKTPERGGGTVFPNADIFVRPKKLTALMFSYKGPKGVHDNELTLHSGCPVKAGEKWIAASWLREGVSEQDSYFHYDAFGVPVLEFEPAQHEEVSEEIYEEDEEEEAFINLADEL